MWTKKNSNFLDEGPCGPVGTDVQRTIRGTRSGLTLDMEDAVPYLIFSAIAVGRLSAAAQRSRMANRPPRRKGI